MGEWSGSAYNPKNAKSLYCFKVDHKVLARTFEALLAQAQNRVYFYPSDEVSIQQEIQYYKYGMDGVLPPMWEKVYSQVETSMKKEMDPEYQEYIRLKTKFENKSIF